MWFRKKKKKTVYLFSRFLFYLHFGCIFDILVVGRLRVKLIVSVLHQDILSTYRKSVRK